MWMIKAYRDRTRSSVRMMPPYMRMSGSLIWMSLSYT